MRKGSARQQDLTGIREFRQRPGHEGVTPVRPAVTRGEAQPCAWQGGGKQQPEVPQQGTCTCGAPTPPPGLAGTHTAGPADLSHTRSADLERQRCLEFDLSW